MEKTDQKTVAADQKESKPGIGSEFVIPSGPKNKKTLESDDSILTIIVKIITILLLSKRRTKKEDF